MKRRARAAQPNVVGEVHPQAGADDGISRYALPLLNILNIKGGLLDKESREARRNAEARPVKPLVVIAQVLNGNTFDAPSLIAVDGIAALALGYGRLLLAENQP